MNSDQIRAILISDFNMDTFSGYLTNDAQLASIIPLVAPFGQVTQVLMDDKMECWKQSSDLAIVWTRPEGVIDSFSKALNFNSTTIKEVLIDVDAYSDHLARLVERVKVIFVPT